MKNNLNNLIDEEGIGGVVFKREFPDINGVAAYALVSELSIENENEHLLIEFRKDGETDKELVERCLRENKVFLLPDKGAVQAMVAITGVEFEKGSAESFVYRQIVKHDDDHHLSLGVNPYSFAWMVRPAYDAGFDQLDIIKNTTHAIRVMMRVIREKPKALDETFKAYDDILVKIKRHFGPFTLSRYLRDLLLLEYPEEEIRRRVLWFLDIHDTIHNLIAVATALKPEIVDFREANGRMIAYFENDNRFIVRAFRDKYDTIAIKSSTGNVIIFSDSFMYKKGIPTLWERLNEKEPGKWMYDKSVESCRFVANGTKIEKSEPTAFSSQELMVFVKKNIF